MHILTQITHDPGLNITGHSMQREAVRGICMLGSRLLMIKSEKVGDYKFPGGGVQSNITCPVFPYNTYVLLRCGSSHPAYAEYSAHGI